MFTFGSKFFTSFLGMGFTWFYGITVILSQIVRGTELERRFWKFYVMDAVLGFLLGPGGFTFVFRDVFSEADKGVIAILLRAYEYGTILGFVTFLGTFSGIATLLGILFDIGA